MDEALVEDTRQRGQEELTELADAWRKEEITLLIEQFLNWHILKNRKNVGERILQLREMFQEEEGSDADISPDSLRAFLTLVHRTPYEREPDISLTPAGDLYIRWRKDPKTIFSIHFLTDKIVRFMIFQPNDCHPEIVNRFSGIDAVDTVWTTFKNSSNKVHEWIAPAV